MALFGIYGKHTVDACPWNNIENAKIAKEIAEARVKTHQKIVSGIWLPWLRQTILSGRRQPG